MKPKSITVTFSDGSHTEYDRKYMAVVMVGNGSIMTAADANTTDIIIGTAWLNAKAAIALLKERRSGLQRMLPRLRYLSRLIYAFFACYKIATKEAQYE